MKDKRKRSLPRPSGLPNEEEGRLQSIFQHSAVSLWEEDISVLRAALDRLRISGVVDMPKYLDEHPEFLREAARMIIVRNVNEATLALYEVADRRQLLGPLDRTLDLNDPLTLESLRDDIQLIASGGTKLERESRATTPSGKKLDILISLSVPSPDDAYPHMLVNVLDITRRKQAEEELYKSRQLLQIVLDHVEQRVFWKDMGSRYLGCNRPFAEDAGLPDPASIVGKDDNELPWHTDAADYRANDALVLNSGVPKLDYERLQTRADGNIQRIRASKVPLRRQDGLVVGVLGTYDDITVERQAQEALRESEKHYYEMFLSAQRQARELELLNTVRTALMRELELPEVIRTVVEGIATAFGYTHVSAYLIRGDTLELQHQVGYKTTRDKIPISQGVSGRVVKTGLPVLVEDVRRDTDFIWAVKDVRSEVCIPLFDQKQVVGILNVESTKEMSLDEADLRLITALGEHVSIAISRARLYADLRQSEERYRTLVENLGEGIAIVDPTETFRFANTAAEKVFGVTPGSLIGKNLQNFLAAEEFQRAREETKKRRRGETSTFEQQLIRPDGSMCWIELTATPQFDQAGVFSHTLGIFRDITDSKNSERNLRESEERFRQLAEAALEGIAITEKGIVVDGNTRLTTMLGYELTEMIGRPVSDFIAPESRAMVAEHIVKNYTGLYEHSLRRKDGSALPVESHARMINWNGRPMRVTALHDVSERHHSQEQLQKLSLAVSQSPASIVITDVKGNIEYVNPKFTQVTGYSFEEALGQNPRILKTGVTSPEEYQRLWETITEGKEWRGEFRNRKKNGELFWEMSSISPVKNAANMITHFVAVKEDITERKLSEQQLEVSEERYRRLFEDSPIGIALLGSQREITLTNKRYRDFLGLSEEEIIKRGPVGILHPDDWAASMALSEKLRSGEAPVFRMEQRYIRGDGAVVWADTSIIALRDADGQIIHTIGWVQDITDRKLAQQALKESEERYRMLVELSPDAVVVHSAGRIAFVNSVAVRETGVAEAGDLVGKDIMSFVDPDFHDIVRDRTRRVQQDHSAAPLAVIRLLRVDGTSLEVESYSAPIPWGGAFSSLTILRDISERRKAEQALSQSELRYRRLFEEATEGIVLADEESGIIEDCNLAFQAISGYRREELIGRPQTVLHPPEPGAPLVTAGFADRRGLPDGAIVERVVVTRTGEARNVEIKASVMEIGGRKLVQGFFRDVTERKRLEADLLQAQKMESVGRLAGGVAHDFNNMLSVILGHAEMALELTDPKHPLHAELTEIREAAERSAGLTRQLLAFARKQTVAPKVLDLNQTVEGMLKMLGRLVGENVHLSWQPKVDLWSVRLDPFQVSQILTNLCANARDAITDIGKITIETGNSTFDETYCATHAGFLPGQYVLLAVSDDGRGMDKDTLSHLFEPFFTTKGIGKGTGLGLATTYGIVKQNNGFANVYSEPDHGTTIKLYLPRYVGKRQESTVGTAKPVVRGHGTILLVEDEPAILRVTARILEKHGYTVLAASTPGEAIRLAREHIGGIDLLMTDVVMPEMNGRDLAKNLLALYPNLKRLFTSGYTANVIAHHGVLDEGVHFVQKPFSAEQLVNAIQEVLNSE